MTDNTGLVITNAGPFQPNIKIKQEKVDPEIDQKLQLLNAKVKVEPGVCEQETSDDSGTRSTEENDDKKAIEPVKSSNEILAELFRVFNAAPPEELLDDKNLLKKNNKHSKSKKEKKKKHKKSKSDGECSDTTEDINGVNSSGKHKHKKKKKHKHKHKEENDKTRERDKGELSKDKDRSRDRKHSNNEKVKDEKRDRRILSITLAVKGEHENRKRLNDTEHRDDIPPAKRSYKEASVEKDRIRDRYHNSFYNGFRDRYHERRDSTEREKGRCGYKDKNEKSTHIKADALSDLSLSDEETYLREKQIDRRNVETYEPASQSSRSHNSFYAGTHRKSRERDVLDRRSKLRNPTRSRSRSNSRSRDLGIDKKRLLEIARKNAISMFKRGNLPGCDAMTQELKDKVLLKMRYGGKTVQDLTEFCKKISNGEELSDLSSDEDSDVDKSGNAKAFHHPFQLKEREPIVMRIRKSTTVPVALRKTEDETKAITMQFPVSSGQQHRLSEVWVPVEKNNIPSHLSPTKQSTCTSVVKDAPKNIFLKSMPVEEQQEPAFKSVSGVIPTTISQSVEQYTAAVTDIPTQDPAPSVPAPPPLTPTVLQQPPTAFVPDVPVPSTALPTVASPVTVDSIFPPANDQSLDVSTIITKRLSAMRRLQENPMDSEAIKMMYNSQREMSCWASSKHLPGQFTGSTGANVLTAHELNSGPQQWARRDQLTSTKPVTGGIGMQLLQKMGWKPGEGLGREKTGSLQPLLLDIKLDKRGLVSRDDNGHQQRHAVKIVRPNNIAQTQQNVQDKHPICLLNELTSKRKWTPPQYTLVNDSGPVHGRMFLFSVSLNGQTYTPTQAASTKKMAKLLAAQTCLQQIGILPS